MAGEVTYESLPPILGTMIPASAIYMNATALAPSYMSSASKQTDELWPLIDYVTSPVRTPGISNPFIYPKFQQEDSTASTLTHYNAFFFAGNFFTYEETAIDITGEYHDLVRNGDFVGFTQSTVGSWNHTFYACPTPLDGFDYSTTCSLKTNSTWKKSKTYYQGALKDEYSITTGGSYNAEKNTWGLITHNSDLNREVYVYESQDLMQLRLSDSIYGTTKFAEVGGAYVVELPHAEIYNTYTITPQAVNSSTLTSQTGRTITLNRGQPLNQYSMTFQWSDDGTIANLLYRVFKIIAAYGTPLIYVSSGTLRTRQKTEWIINPDTLEEEEVEATERKIERTATDLIWLDNIPPIQQINRTTYQVTISGRGQP